jgi:polysaccharide biosynthesis/export protein
LIKCITTGKPFSKKYFLNLKTIKEQFKETYIMAKPSLPLIMAINALALFFTSCNTYKKIPYFQDVSKTTPTLIRTGAFNSPVIRVGDKLSVTIETLNSDVTSLMNGSAGVPGGYLVNKNGVINLPFIGEVKVEGFTTFQAQEKIEKEAEKHFNSPVVTVRYSNFIITVLGEVTRPGSFVSPNEKINVLDALGLAGDLTQYAKREDIFLIRDSLNEKAFIPMNLLSKDIISSPYFYLQPNDVIYVTPDKTIINKQETQVTRLNIQIVTGLVSLALIIVAVIQGKK